MEINNFNIIKELIIPKDGQFYFMQIIRRRKDQSNNNDPKDHRIIKSYHITHPDDLIDIEEDVKQLCEFYNARAYINLGRRSYERIAHELNIALANQLFHKSYENLHKLYNTTVGKTKGEGPCWVIDVDTKDPIILNNVMFAIEQCDSEYNSDEIIHKVIPTVQGYHLITYPFNRRQLEPCQVKYDLDIHVNNPTLLYSNII